MELPAAPRSLAQALVDWFDDKRRALPWRFDRTPYRVWLSEVMLQQTRVSVVVDYFERFVAKFPDVEALAAASEEEVLGLWSGLGYYSRGRNLHKAARVVARRGGFPATAAGLLELPGVGDYTAAAIASFAFGESSAVVDGNVMRVLARLCDEHTPVDAPAAKARMKERAQQLVDASSSSAAVNEGLMELGALVCTPKSPACSECPWSTSCRAFAKGTAASLPVKSPKRARKKLHVASVVVVDKRGRVWLEKRVSRGLFGGLLEPPSAEVVRDDVEQAWTGLLQARGLAKPRGAWPAAIEVDRTLTHRELKFSVVRLDVAQPPRGAPFVDDVGGAALSSAVRAVLASVGVD